MDAKNAPKVAIGFILYNSMKYLPDFLETLMKQDYSNTVIYAINANQDKENDDVKYIRENYPEIKLIQPGFNTGFAKGHNIMMNQSIEDKAEFYLAINFDMILEQNFVSELLNVVIKTPRIGSATGKLKRWDFENKNNSDQGKTNFIDTTGLKVTKEHRFLDRAQGDIDHGQYNKEEEIFGSSGAAVMYRLSALKDVAFVNKDGKIEFFDELMFMYKEDVDLAYRLQWGGYKCIYNPDAIAYHDRTIAAKGSGILSVIKNRWGRESKFKEWSWVNHHIILKKFIDNDFSFKIKWKTFIYELKTFFYILFFEPFLLKQFLTLWKLRKEVRDRKDQIKKRIDVKKNIERWME
jgi:GT2 family glycosyltransferase